MDNLTTYEIIKKCRSMDRKAQNELYKGYYNYAMSIALRYSDNRDDSVELLNDSFLKVFTKIKQFEHGGNFKSWIRKIIINTSIDRSRTLKIIYDDLVNISETNSLNFDENLLDNLNAEDIIKVIQKLPDIYRITFNLYEIEGYSHKEIAKMLNINESKSRSNLSRAKKRLRILLNENFDCEKN